MTISTPPVSVWNLATLGLEADGPAQAQQVAASHGRARDLMVALTTSGPSESFVDALEQLLGEKPASGMLPLRADGRALFVARGQDWENVQVATSWREWTQHPVQLLWIPGTDLHVGLAEVPHGVHQYKIVYNHHYWADDPHAAWVAPDRRPVPKFSLGHFNSVLAMGVSPTEGGEAFLYRPAFRSEIMDNERDVWVWLPPSYQAEPKRRYPTLYFLDGNEAITRIFPHDIVRDLAARGEAEECIMVFAAFADQKDRIDEFAGPEGRVRYADFFLSELVPVIDRQFRTDGDPSTRGMVGVSLGANFTYYLSWRRPEIFGAAAGQGGAWSWKEWELLRLFESTPRKALRLYMDSSRRIEEGGVHDASEDSHGMQQGLERLGYSVTHVEHAGEDHDWPSWKARMPELVRWFAPVRPHSEEGLKKTRGRKK